MRDFDIVSPADPLDLFRSWYAEAGSTLQTNVIALATADAAGSPSVRFVHFKGLQAGCFVFYTDYHSRKSREIAVNPKIALAFYWASLRRQVRVEGRCSRVDRAVSERYFAQRDRETQLTCAASEQSAELSSIEALASRIERMRAMYAGQEIPCPPGWGGMIVEPERVEFWEGQPHRRHRRCQYVRNGSDWQARLLFP